MRTLVVLAVFGVCLVSAQFTPEVEAERARFFEAFRAAKQAASSSKYSEPQPAYRGPFAASVPAGVDGRVTPVSDTAEVRTATDAFYRAYRAQVEATKGSSDSASYVLKTDPATSAKYVLKTDTATSNRYLYKAVPSPSYRAKSGSETSVKYLLKTDPETSSKYLYKPDPGTAAEYAAKPYSAGSAKYVVKTNPETSVKYLFKAVPTTSGTYVVKDDPQTPYKYELQAVPQTSATYRAKTDPAYLAKQGYEGSPVYVAKVAPSTAEFRTKGDPAYKAKSDPAYVAKVVPAATYVQQPRWPGPFASSVPAGLPGSPGQVPYTQEVLDAKYAFQKAYQRQLEAVSN
ncbi:adhesive plaque matrix protein-like [Macrobrachium nipponense]|uniref:adhesive plaque matrix protein-like n=1 Tax=Macrobrachium nipponense TaxID=159736 RepID=UPI0030C7E77C